jgi:predicted Ser/Thr protein kinase
MSKTRTLKTDGLGTTRLVEHAGAFGVERDTRTARTGARWLARRLAAREAAALAALEGIPGVPRLLRFDGDVVRRSYLAGSPLYEQPPQSRAYFVAALRLVRALHRAGIAHNDLAKEANWLCGPGDTPAVVDFQIAVRSRNRGKLFRNLALADLRHLLKHKRTYQPDRLTARQRALLAAPGTLTTLWRMLWKPPYTAVTRALLRWPERSGPIERQR